MKKISTLNLLKAFSGVGMFLLFFISQSSLGQTTPSFHNNANAAAGSNIFPLNSANNKVQWIYGPSVFHSNGATGTPAFAGLITTVYFRLGGSANATSVYNDFTISLAQNVGVQNSWTSAVYNTGMTQCLYQQSFSLTGAAANSWVGITLQTPFMYDPSQSLVFEMQTSSTSGGNSVAQVTTSGMNQRIWGPYGSSTGANFGTALLDFGFDLVTAPPCSGTPAPGNTLTSTKDVCPNENFLLSLQNFLAFSGLSYQWQSAPDH